MTESIEFMNRKTRMYEATQKRECLLESGNIKRYDACGDTAHSYGAGYKYIGKGVIVGAEYNGQKHFFIKK